MLNPHRFVINFWLVLLLELEDLTIKLLLDKEENTAGTTDNSDYAPQ